jgi:zinc D-Ala-D-Ala carboxypeptidase
MTAGLAATLVAAVVVTAAAPAHAGVPSRLNSVAAPILTSPQLSQQIQTANALRANLISSDAAIAGVNSSLENLAVQANTLWATRSATWTAQVAAETDASVQRTRLGVVTRQVRVARRALGQQANEYWIGGGGPLVDIAAALEALTAPAPNQSIGSLATLGYLVISRARLLSHLETVQSTQGAISARAAAAAKLATATAEGAARAKSTSETVIAAQRIAQKGLWATQAAQVGWAAGVRVTLLRSEDPTASAADRQLAQALAGRDFTLLMNQSSSCGTGPTNYPNGQWPPGSLCPLYAAPDQSLRRPAALAFDAMSHTYEQQTGSAMCVTEGYRSLADQNSIKAATPNLAATPGTSKHGLGLAIDLCGGVQDFTSPAHLWMNRNAALFGWVHPAWAEPSGSQPEPWHWEFVG